MPVIVIAGKRQQQGPAGKWSAWIGNGVGYDKAGYDC